MRRLGRFSLDSFPSGDGTQTFRPPANLVPHRQGRNIIPIALSPGATSVGRAPDAIGSKGTPEHMLGILKARIVSGGTIAPASTRPR